MKGYRQCEMVYDPDRNMVSCSVHKWSRRANGPDAAYNALVKHGDEKLAEAVARSMTTAVIRSLGGN